MTRPITVTRPRRRSLRTLAVVGLATACVIPAADAWAGGHRGGPRVAHPVAAPAARPAAQWAFGQALHGDLVLPAKTGTQTVTLQRGVITAVTDTSITVKSPDGFTEQWTVTDGTKVTGRGDRRRPRPHRVVSPTSDSPTADAAVAAPAAPTDGLVEKQQVQIWGTTSGVNGIASSSSATASALIVVRQAPRTSSPSATTSTTAPTTASTTTAPTTSSDDPTTS